MKPTAPGRLAALVVLLSLGAPPSSAGAHAEFMRSEPADGQSIEKGPNEVIFWYTEAIEVDSSNAYVVDAAGKRWEAPAEDAFHIHDDPTNPGLIMMPNMPDGSYNVSWEVLSAVDGHRTEGSYTFSVGPPISSPSGDSPTAFAVSGGGDGETGQDADEQESSSEDSSRDPLVIIAIIAVVAAVIAGGAAAIHRMRRSRA